MSRLDKRELIDDEEDETSLGKQEEENTEDFDEDNIEEPETEEVEEPNDTDESDDEVEESESESEFYIVKHRGEEKKIPKDDEKVLALLSKGLEMDTFKQEHSSDIEFANMLKQNPEAIQALKRFFTTGNIDDLQNVAKDSETKEEQIVDNEEPEDDDDEILMTKSEIVNVMKNILNSEYGMDEIMRLRENEKFIMEYNNLKQTTTIDIPLEYRESFSDYFNSTLDILPDQIIEVLANDKKAYVDYVEKVKATFLSNTDTKKMKSETVSNNDTKTNSTGNTGKKRKAPIQKSSTSIKTEQSNDEEDLSNLSFEELKQLAKKKKFKLSDIIGN